VNNAGISRVGTLVEMDMAVIQQILDVNLRGVIVATKHTLPHMGAGGRIINIGSNLAERVHIVGAAIYAATKSALRSLTRGWARDLGPQDITVVMINPGPTDTEMNPEDSPKGEMLRKVIPLGRYAKAEQIADAVTFVAGPGASHITGTSISVDGGFNC